jgi:ABC-type transport system substrate-binding protein
MLMWTEARPAGYISQKIYNFSKQADSPVKDVRVRRAFSMTLERDLYIDAMENTSQFEKEGIPVETAWNGPLAAFFPSWIDPRDEKEFGEAAKYYKYDVAEAKKLVQAAGLTKVKMPWGYYTDRGSDHVKINEIVVNMAVDSGLFDVTLEPLPYASTWRDVCQYSNGAGFAGACYNSADGFNEDAYMVNIYTPEGKFATFPTAQPGFTDEILKVRQEVDPKKRSEMLKAFQRKVATEFHYLPIPGRSLQFTLRWPWLMNSGVFEQGGTSARTFAEVWLDPSKKV